MAVFAQIGIAMSNNGSSFLSSVRWDTYHPKWNKIIFGIALLGVLLTIHLAIQEQRGFVEGCTGFEGLEAGQTFNCAAVLESDAAALFGISNVWWGFLFYTTVAALGVAVAFASTRMRAFAQQFRAGLVTFGVFYSAYLLYYQFAHIGEFCLLCLISAAIVVGLFGAVVVSLTQEPPRQPRKRATRDKHKKKEAGTFAVLVVGLLVLAGADYAYFGAQGGADLEDEIVEGCAYDPEHEPIADYEQYISTSDIFTGNPDADVTVVEFFDPNCPACRMFHPVMNQVVQQYSDQARFVFKPMALWEHSVNQIQALYIAAQQGEFFSLLGQQYDHQQQQGLSDDELVSIAENTGLDPDVLRSGLEEDRYQGHVMNMRQQAVSMGVPGTPTVMINGRFVHSESRTPDCLGAMIEAAAEN